MKPGGRGGGGFNDRIGCQWLGEIIKQEREKKEKKNYSRWGTMRLVREGLTLIGFGEICKVVDQNASTRL